MKPLLFHILLFLHPLRTISTNERTLFVSKQDTAFAFRALENDIRFQLNLPQKSFDSLTYQLEGFDAKPISTVYPEIRYTNVKGGSYRLNTIFYRVGKPFEKSSISIQIEKELSEEWWFYPAILFYLFLLVGAAFYFFMLNNFRQKLKVATLRNQIAADLHDEVGSTLSSIAFSSNLVNRKLGNIPTDVQEILSQIKNDSEETIHTIRDTVWTINPDNDSMEKLIEKLRSFAVLLFSSKQIQFHFLNEVVDIHKFRLLMEQRRNAYLILREGLNNISKHSEATAAWMHIFKHDKAICIELIDNGKGFDTANSYEGNGLKNYAWRAKEGLMDFEIESEIGKGTKLKLTISEL